MSENKLYIVGIDASGDEYLPGVVLKCLSEVGPADPQAVAAKAFFGLSDAEAYQTEMRETFRQTIMPDFIRIYEVAV